MFSSFSIKIGIFITMYLFSSFVREPEGVFTRYDYDCSFLSQQIGSVEYQCKSSYGMIVTMTLSPMQPTIAWDLDS